MKKIAINAHNPPENQVELPKTEEHIALATHRSPDPSNVAIAKADVEHAASPEHSRWELRNPTSDFRNCDDLSDIEQVEYAERPYLCDEGWFD